MPYHIIQIRFIRRTRAGIADNNPQNDDILKIIRLGENSVRLIYTEKSDDVVMVDVMNFNYHQMVSYLYRLFWLTGLDEDPFQSVQFFIPGYPTFLIQVPALKDNVTRILDLIVSTCWNWPTIGELRQENDRISTHLLPVGSPQEPANSGDYCNGPDCV